MVRAANVHREAATRRHAMRLDKRVQLGAQQPLDRHRRPLEPLELALVDRSEGAAPELTLGVGTVSRMAGRCCAFVRGVKPGEPIAADKASTTELMFTEMHSSALGALSTFLDG